MREQLADERVPIGYSARYREYWLPLIAGHDARQLLSFCPWCGVKLPRSLRDKYFNAVEPLGFDAMTDKNDLPPQYRDDTRWRESGLD